MSFVRGGRGKVLARAVGEFGCVSRAEAEGREKKQLSLERLMRKVIFSGEIWVLIRKTAAMGFRIKNILLIMDTEGRPSVSGAGKQWEMETK